MFKHAVSALFLAGAVAEPLRAQAGPVPNANAPEIMAAGRGDTVIAPTSAAISVTVTTRAPTAAQAASENAARVEATLSALRALGLSPTELKTVGYSVGPNYEDARNRPRSATFMARNTIRAEVRRVEDLGRVIDAALAGGATEISAVQFLSDHIREARRAALAEAVAEARADAEAIARAAGGTLGRLISTSSGVSFPMYREGYGEMALSAGVAGSEAATRIAPRDLTITAQVSTRWEFVPRPQR